jgi:hypothetical protein
MNAILKLGKASALRWHLLSVEEWLQLARLAQRPATLLNSLLALQKTVAIRGDDRAIDGGATWTSAPRREKKAKWTTLIIIDSQVVQNTCNASVESKDLHRINLKPMYS